MNIRTKLIIGVICSCLTVLLVGAISYLSSQQIQEISQHIKTADTITQNVFNLNIFTNEYLLHQEKRPRIQWETQYHRLHRLLQESRFSAPNNQILITKLLDDLEKLEALFSEIVSIHSRPPDFNEKLFRELQSYLQNQVLLKSQRMLSHVSQLKDQLEHEHLSIQRRTRWLTIVFVSGFAIVISSLGLLIARSISRPLADLIKNTETITAGNLEVHLAAEKHDEIGILSQSFTRMVESN